LVINIVYVYPAMLDAARGAQGPEATGAAFGIIGGVVGSLIGLAFPVLLLIFMTRSRIVAAFAGETDLLSRAATGAVDAEMSSTDASQPLSAASAADDNPYRSPATPSAAAMPPVRSSDAAISTLIPYQNSPALIAYYLGLFSLSACIPLLGIVGVIMAIAAVVLGLKGLRLAKENESAKGRVHAWIGVICGSVCGVVGLVINVAVLVAIVSEMAGP
jgi:hypothetical protein